MNKNCGFIIFLCLITSATVYSQSGSCDPATPFFVVDMTGDPDSVFTQINGSKVRNLECCGLTSTDCIEFEVTIDENSTGISFEAIGAGLIKEFQIDCNASVYNSGDFVCLEGIGPYTLTFCDTSGISFNYIISSIDGSITIDSTITDVSCNNGTDGSIDFDITGGSTPFTYQWSTGSTSKNVTGLAFGSYYVTLIDANTCQDTLSFNVNQPDVIVVSGTEEDPTCYDGNDGEISNVVVTGGTPDYCYSWSDINPTARWTFENTMDDISGNSNNPTAFVGLENYATDATERDSSFDFDGSTKIAYSVSGGLMDTDFSTRTIMMWVKPDALVGDQVLYEEGNTNSGIALQLSGTTLEAAVRETFSEQNAGTIAFPPDGNWHHIALVYDNGDLTLYLDSLPGITTVTGFTTISATGSDGGLGGTLSSNAFGSSNDDFYAGLMDDVYYLNTALSPDQIADIMLSNGNRTDLYAGTYNLTVTDVNGCTSTNSFVLSEPDALVLSLDSVDISCFGLTNGSINLGVSGGTGAYTYVWSGGAGTGEDPTNLVEGTYTVTVTDAVGCTQIDSISINEPEVLSLSATIDSIKCAGGNDGAIDLEVEGGTGAYTYLWNNSAGTGEDPSGLSANTYTVTVSDENSCSQTLSVVLTSIPSISIADSLNDASCFGGNDGSIYLTISNGTPPYQFNWGNGFGANSDTTGLVAGSYSVTVLDDQNCQVSTILNIGEAVEMDVIPSVSAVSCNGGDDGRVVTVTVNGGTPGYTFEWSDIKPEGHWTFEETLDDISGNDHNYNADSEGTFYLSTDAAERDYSMYFDGATRIAFDEPLGGFMDSSFTERTISLWFKPVAFAGKQTLFEEGNGFYGIAVRLEGNRLRAGVSDAPILDQVLEGPVLPAADQWYHVAIVYNNSDFYLYLDGEEVDFLDTGLGEIPSTESGGGIGGNIGYDAIYDGLFGEGDFFYTGRMDDVRYYEVALDSMQVVDEMRNDGTRNNLLASSYTVTVHDANACIQTETITITQPPALTLSINGNDLSCNGADDGTAKATVGGGVEPYTYNWLSGQSTDSISNLAGGKYHLTLTDFNGCTIVDSVTINEPSIIIPDVDVTSVYLGQDVSCYGATDGEVSVSASGGNGSFTYLWSYGGVTSNTIENVGAGVYYVTVTDGQGCTASDTVTVVNPDSMTVSIIETNLVSCKGDSDGAAQVSVNNGNSPFEITWEGGQTGTDLIGVTAGTYSVTVKDVLECITIDSITIFEPDSLIVGVSVTSDFNSFDVSCLGGTDGAAQANPSGGTSPYSYQWSVSGQTNQSIASLSGNTLYSVTVTDAKDCTAVGTITLNEPTGLSATYSLADPNDCGLNDGEITVNASGGTGNYEYRLSTGSWQSSNTFNGLAPGVYNIYTRSMPGTCVIGPFAQVLSLPASPSFDNITLINPSTNVSTDGAILINASGSGVQINFQLLDNLGNVLVPWQDDYLFSGLTEGTYQVQLKYYNQSCIASLDVTLIAGGGIVGSITGIDYCSGELNSAQFVETYFIPIPEDQVLAALNGIVPSSCSTSGTPSDPVSTYISIGIVETGTIIYYDHYEVDGFEANLSDPVQSSTEIWGDNIDGNGKPPGYATDYLIAGQNIILENEVITSTRTTVVDYDGGDKIGSRGNISITRLAWADDTETLLAGAVEVYPTALWGTSYVIPVGEDNDVNGMFEYTGAVVMAQEGGTSLSIDADANGSFEIVTTLAEGESYHLNGNVNAGAIVNSSKPVQVHLLTGDRCATYESRFFTLKPTGQWSDSYFCPVSTLGDGTASTSSTNHPTYVHFYNPNSSNITINWETNSGAQTAITVSTGVNATAIIEIPNGSGAHFYSSGNEPFYAIGTIDSDPDGSSNNSGHDWGFALIPESQLTSQITTIGFAPGNDPSNPSVCCNGFTWSLDNVSSENTGAGNNAVFAFDNDPSTFWQSAAAATYPHFIDINLIGTNTFDGFKYTPRQDGSTIGRVQDYEFYYWDSFSSSWILADTGTLINTGSPQDVYFSSPVTAYLVRFRAINEVNGNQWASMGEFDLLRNENSAPVWLTTGFPTGSTSTGTIEVCIDYNGDGGINTDLNGVMYDQKYTLNEFDRIKIYDSDGDQTGMKIWVCDTTDALIAGAWGQDPATASGASPAIDLGVGLPNGIPFASAKCVDLSRDYNSNGLFDECDEVIYSITIRNTGALPLEVGSLTVIDTLPTQLTYINNSTVIFQGPSITGIPDDTGADTPFPLDEGGEVFNYNIPPGDSAVIRFEISINSVMTGGFVTNKAIIQNGTKTLQPDVTFPIEDPTNPTIASIPADTLINCEASIPAPPFTDTCMLEFFIPQNEMTIDSVDSEESNGLAFLMLDGNPATHWHTEYLSSTPSHPHEIHLDLGGDYPVTGFLYTPRQVGSNGRMADYEFYISMDGNNWGSAMASGTWTDGTEQQEVDINQTTARYIRLVALSEVNGNPWTSIAELNIKYCATTLTYTEIDPAGTCSYDITRTWNITNYCGRTADQTQTITVQDTTGPVITGVPVDLTIDAASVPSPPTLTATDNCYGAPTVSYVADTTFSSCAFTITRTWSATDNCSNTSQSSQTILVDAPLTLSASVTSTYEGSQISCHDSNNGVTLAVPQGGNLPIEYLWSSGHTTAEASGLTAGDYTVTATDDDGCEAIASVTVVPPDSINITLTITSSYSDSTISCYGESDGNVLATASGGTGVLSYEWNEGTTSQNLNNISAGIYVVTVTDENLCSAEKSITIYEPDSLTVNPLVVSSIGGFQLSCYGGSDGVITANPNGGTEPYVYLWEDGETTAGLSDVPSGMYYVTLTDANNCTTTDSVEVFDPPIIDLDLSITSNYNGADVSCNGASDGSARVDVTGGNPPYSFVWGTALPVTIDSLTNIPAGVYAVTVTDDNGCMIADSIELTNPLLLTLSVASVLDYSGFEVSCYEAVDAKITTSTSGGTGAYTFLWSNGATTDSLLGVGAGNYSLVVKDANDCEATLDVTIAEPPLLQIADTTLVDPSLCNANDGSISILASGGIGFYEYRINTDAWQDSSNIYQNLSAGNYNVYVRDSAGNCVEGPLSLVLENPIPQACPVIPPSNPLTVCTSNIGVKFYIDAPSDATGFVWTAPLNTTILSGQGTDTIVVDMTGIAVGTHNICVVTQSDCGDSPSCCFSFDAIACQEICDNGIDDDEDGLEDCEDPDCEVIANINVSDSIVCIYETVNIFADNAGTGATYQWDFGGGASPATAIGIGPHSVAYNSCGVKNVSLLVARNGCNELDNFSILVQDTIKPVWDTLPSNLVVECDGTADPAGVIAAWFANNGNGVASDNCGAVVITYNYPGLEQDCGLSGSADVTFTATDECGNDTSRLVTLTILDRVSPIFVSGIPNDTIVECDSIPNPPVISTDIVVQDVCSIDISIDFDEQRVDSTCANLYRLIRTWTATDDCDNSTTAQQTIIVRDTKEPIIVGVPGDTLVECHDIPLAPVIGTDITASDNCDPSIGITYSEVAVYHTTSNWKNTASCGILYSVTDVICDDAGTPGTGDDTMTFNLTVIGKNVGLNWSAVIDGNPVSGEYYQVYNLGAYSASGSLNFTIQDQASPVCTADVTVNLSDCE